MIAFKGRHKDKVFMLFLYIVHNCYILYENDNSNTKKIKRKDFWLRVNESLA